MHTKHIYYFGKTRVDSSLEPPNNHQISDILGNKGARLSEMTHLGFSVPPGFILTSKVCELYYENNKQLPQAIKEEIHDYVTLLEKELNKKFGRDLFLAVRSGAACSMPGMMDTILNIGMNDHTAWCLAKSSNNERFAYNTYRNFIQMYGTVVYKIQRSYFDEVLNTKKQALEIIDEQDLTIASLKELIQEYQEIIAQKDTQLFMQDVHIQLFTAIEAVFSSWRNERAIAYRELKGISHDNGTAVSVQAMVFGNSGPKSATGVAFSRDPSTGEKTLFGEYILNAQGEELVNGSKTPRPLTTEIDQHIHGIYAKINANVQGLEKHYRDLQDVEFTVENGKLFILQTRSGLRNALAGLNIAVDMAEEGLITREEAVMRLDSTALDKLLHPAIDESKEYTVIAKGLAASPGATSGIVVFSPEEVLEYTKSSGKKIDSIDTVILVRNETSPEDIQAISRANGIITARGGMTSHAAVVTRGMGKPCICSADITVGEDSFTTGQGVVVRRGETITLDGNNGRIISGKALLQTPKLTDAFFKLLHWTDEISALKVRANADTAKEVTLAKYFNAAGVGLCRTEHMFFTDQNINLVRKMILLNDPVKRSRVLRQLENIQYNAFVEMFDIMSDKPLTIRLLDPPLHEFLPRNIDEFVTATKLSKSFVEERVKSLTEENPMLGKRGCRLGILYPENISNASQSNI